MAPGKGNTGKGTNEQQNKKSTTNDIPGINELITELIQKFDSINNVVSSQQNSINNIMISNQNHFDDLKNSLILKQNESLEDLKNELKSHIETTIKESLFDKNLITNSNGSNSRLIFSENGNYTTDTSLSLSVLTKSSHHSQNILKMINQVMAIYKDNIFWFIQENIIKLFEIHCNWEDIKSTINKESLLPQKEEDSDKNQKDAPAILRTNTASFTSLLSLK